MYVAIGSLSGQHCPDLLVRLENYEIGQANIKFQRLTGVVGHGHYPKDLWYDLKLL